MHCWLLWMTATNWISLFQLNLFLVSRNSLFVVVIYFSHRWMLFGWIYFDPRITMKIEGKITEESWGAANMMMIKFECSRGMRIFHLYLFIPFDYIIRAMGTHVLVIYGGDKMSLVVVVGKAAYDTANWKCLRHIDRIHISHIGYQSYSYQNHMLTTGNNSNNVAAECVSVTHTHIYIRHATVWQPQPDIKANALTLARNKQFKWKGKYG